MSKVYKTQHVPEDRRQFIVSAYKRLQSVRRVNEFLRTAYGKGYGLGTVLAVLREEGVEVRPQYRGDGSGRCVDRRGYVRIYVGRSHERASSAGLVYEWVLVAEAKIGRRLRENEVAHHRNGNPGDDRPENLMVVTKSTHSKIHVILRRLERQYRSEYEQRTGTPFDEGVSLRYLWEEWHVAYIDPILDELNETNNGADSVVHQALNEEEVA